MTAVPSIAQDKTLDILRPWQAEAIRHWKHIDPVLLSVNGPIWKAMSGVIAMLDVGARLAASLASSEEYAKSAYDMQSAALVGCAEQLAALPVSWADLRAMLRALSAQMRRMEVERGSLNGQRETLFVDGAMEALAARVADIEITRLEQQTASQQEQTLATQHLAERFLGNASHELRTPLTAIMGFAELLLEGMYGELTPQQAERVSNIENSAQNLNEIVSNMLDLLHIRAGKLALQYRPVDVTSMLQHLYEILMPLAGAKTFSLR